MRPLPLALGLVSLALLASFATPDRDRGTCSVLPAGAWELAWDDVVDGALPDDPKATGLRLDVARDRVRGAFDGPVFGEERDAHFTGQVIHADGSPVVLLQQHEPGYRCVYQLQRQPDGELRGVWHDTRARSGDVVLRRGS